MLDVVSPRQESKRSVAHDSQSSSGDYESSSEEQKDTQENKEDEVKGEFGEIGIMSDKDSEGSDHNPDKRCQNLYDILKFIGVLLY